MPHRATYTILIFLLCGSGCAMMAKPGGSRTPLLKGETVESRLEKEQNDSTLSEESYESKREPLTAFARPGTKSIHDPATRMLINAELRDATPEERQAWMNYLATVEADKVPYLLRGRRVSKNYATVDQLAEAAVPTGIQQASAQTKVDQTSKAQGVISAHSEQKAEKEAVATASTLTWPQRIRSLADFDANRLWPLGTAETADATAGEKSAKSPFALPQILGNDSSEPTASETTPEETPVQTVAVESPSLSSASELRISPETEVWEDELHKLISLLEAEASAISQTDTKASNRESVRKQVALRLLHLVADDPQLAQQAIPGLTPVEQEFWTALFLALSDSLDQQQLSDPAERATQVVSHLRTAAHHLGKTARLQVRNMVFCEEITSFGNYQSLSSNEFTPGQPLLIYTEIQNFKSELTPESSYRTRIRSTIELYRGSAEGQLIDRTSFGTTEDHSRTLRSDYFHSYRLELPAHLTPGPYMVKLTIQDEATGKLATATLPFTVR